MTSTLQQAVRIEEWTVDYGTAPSSVRVPHAWRQEVDVRWEGPAIYATTIDVPQSGWLIFEGVSYQARVFVDGQLVLERRGIWDAFAVDLFPWAGRTVDIRVEVVKSGGPTFPVRDSLSGFLPFVFHTFGGVFGDVWLGSSETPPDLTPPTPPSRLSVDGTAIHLDGQPWSMRGVLTWGWYPEVGHTHPPLETIEAEIAQMRAMGFNLVKFCLWLPPHRYLEALDRHGMLAWIELPLWDPTNDPERLEAMFNECERIVLQYRRHANVLCWTCGCELSDSTSADFRRRLVEMVQRHTGCPLVKDNSGGAEMYGGDPREYGTFDDFHPYCELNQFAPVLESLTHGPRRPIPILLGETNDYDVHRDLIELSEAAPFWTSSDPALNAQGVRWQHDLPAILEGEALARQESEERSKRLQTASESKSRFIRKSVFETVRSLESMAGYVLTGWRHTPISTSGCVDDFGRPVEGFDLAEIQRSADLFLLPARRPPWIAGGNRPGWQDPFNRWAGPARLRFGARLREAERAEAVVRLWRDDALLAETLLGKIELPAEVPVELPAFDYDFTPGRHRLELTVGGITNCWQINAFAPIDAAQWRPWRWRDLVDFALGATFGEGPNLIVRHLDAVAIAAWRNGANVVAFVQDEGTIPAPFWRECIHETLDNRPWLEPFAAKRWEELAALACDRTLDEAFWNAAVGAAGVAPLRRIDTRTYVSTPYVLEYPGERSTLVVTSLRLYGGMGTVPYGFKNNVAGAVALARLLQNLESAPPEHA